MIEACPLHWPLGFTRTTNPKRAPFKCTLGGARDGVLNQIRLMKETKNVIISSNMPLKANGDMYATKISLTDHGAAVYFTWKGVNYTIACDQWDRFEHNMQAIRKTLEAMRGLDRWGCSDMLARSFAGFTAIPEKVEVHHKTANDVLGVPEAATKEQITRAYRAKAKVVHPDVQGGDGRQFNELTDAYDAMMKKLKQDKK